MAQPEEEVKDSSGAVLVIGGTAWLRSDARIVGLAVPGVDDTGEKLGLCAVLALARDVGHVKKELSTSGQTATRADRCAPRIA